MRSKTLSAAALALLASACSAAGTNQTVPTGSSGTTESGIANVNGMQQTIGAVQPDTDTTSVLKTLTKQTTIGSTVDPTNGDQTPSGVSYVEQNPYPSGGKFKKGDLLVCNYADKNGVQGNGTTEELLSSTPGSKPVTFIQNAALKGCSSLSLDQEYGGVYTADSVAKNAAQTTDKAKIFQTITGTMTQPYSGVYLGFTLGYPPGQGFWVGDATAGTVWRIDLGTSQKKPPVTGVVTGFAVNKGKPGSVLGPTVAMSEKGKGPVTMFVVDGASNILYSFSNVYYSLAQAGAVKIGTGGKTFTGPSAKDAKVLFAGTPLKGSISMTALPNGNVIVANSTANELIEIDTAGKVLATKTVDKGAAGAIRGIFAVGTNDTNTELYFTDSNSNTVQLLSK